MSPQPPGIKGEDVLATALIAVPLVGTALVSDYQPFLAPVALALIVHGVGAAIGKRPTFELGIVGYALASLPVALLFQTFRVSGAQGQQIHASFYFALGCLVFACLRLCSPRGASRLAWTMLFGAVALTANGLGLPDWLDGGPAWHGRFPGGKGPHPTRFYVGLVAAFGGLSLLVARLSMWHARRGDAPSRGLRGAVGLAMLVTCGLSFAVSQAVTVYYDDVNAAFLRMFSGARLRSSGGFSGEARLGTVIGMREGSGSRRVALEVYTEQAPGYLKGKTFLGYGGGRWHTGDPSPVVDYARADEAGRYALEGRVTPTDATTLTVYPASHISAHFFLPLATTAIHTETEQLLIGPGDALRTGDRPTTLGYDVFVDLDQPNHQEVDWPDYVELPDDEALLAAVDRRLDEAGVAAVDTANPADAVGPLERWFARAYDYQFGIEFDDESDPLEQFLTEKSHGHCELFASAGALMLRRLGIRARYVTGFICDEKNDYSDLYLARDEYAHAWVEYHDPQRGWQIAEFTPAGGMPAITPAQGSEAFFDHLKSLWTRLVGLFRGGFAGLPGRLGDALRSLVLWIADAWWRMAILVGVVVVYLARSLIRRRAGRGGDVAYGQRFTPAFASLRERYLALEAQLEQAGLGRGPAETVLEWVARLDGQALPADDPQAARALIREFAAQRYSQAVVAPPEEMTT